MMFLGLRTAIYEVGHLEEAKAWYTKILGIAPYFDEPFYIGFNVAGYELGLIPQEKDSKGDRIIVYWGVKDARAAIQRLNELGAKTCDEVKDVGGGILVATVFDLSGNQFGIIENPHF